MNLDNEEFLRLDSLEIINEQGNGRQECDTKSYNSAKVYKFFHRGSSYTSIMKEILFSFQAGGLL